MVNDAHSSRLGSVRVAAWALVLVAIVALGATGCEADDEPEAIDTETATELVLEVPGDVEESLGGCPPVSDAQLAALDLAVVGVAVPADDATESSVLYEVDEWVVGVSGGADRVRVRGSNVSIGYFPAGESGQRMLVASTDDGFADPCLTRPWTAELEATYREGAAR